jgi:hypothetical protein
MRGAIPSLPQYIFIAWCLVKHRDNFTFTCTLPGTMIDSSNRNTRRGVVSFNVSIWPSLHALCNTSLFRYDASHYNDQIYIAIKGNISHTRHVVTFHFLRRQTLIKAVNFILKMCRHMLLQDTKIQRNLEFAVPPFWHCYCQRVKSTTGMTVMPRSGHELSTLLKGVRRSSGKRLTQ